MSARRQPNPVRRNSVTIPGPADVDPVSCLEYGYGLGSRAGILVLKYLAGRSLEFGENRQDFLHQLYWSPDGVLSVRCGSDAQFVGPREGFWVRRAVTHEVRAGDGQTVYRVCLRQGNADLERLRAGAVSVSTEAARLLTEIARSGVDEAVALAARDRIVGGLGVSAREFVGHHAAGAGFAMIVARALSHDPGDHTGIDEWAARLHVSAKTLQRDFVREFGMPFSRWRTSLRLRVSRALLETRSVTDVAHEIGYASASAFVAAFAKEYGYTPGTHGPRGALLGAEMGACEAFCACPHRSGAGVPQESEGVARNRVTSGPLNR
ncbi:helix-turn-helix transcriptional regulator [Amycolatopsis nigrescens]|uniref:helix-turn-helix transcriptional regulator n=1 Tax=Amycolatopsis nigrescens TaxID=381445 RepID=UPI00036372E0|nr:AraC family transcriptional regulator [Amycolatopsis nigrescens]